MARSHLDVNACLLGIFKERGDGDTRVVGSIIQALDAVGVQLVALLVLVAGIEPTDVMEDASSFLAQLQRDAEGDVAPVIVSFCDVNVHLSDTVGYCADLLRLTYLGPLNWVETCYLVHDLIKNNNL